MDYQEEDKQLQTMSDDEMMRAVEGKMAEWIEQEQQPSPVEVANPVPEVPHLEPGTVITGPAYVSDVHGRLWFVDPHTGTVKRV